MKRYWQVEPKEFIFSISSNGARCSQTKKVNSICRNQLIYYVIDNFMAYIVSHSGKIINGTVKNFMKTERQKKAEKWFRRELPTVANSAPTSDLRPFSPRRRLWTTPPKDTEKGGERRFRRNPLILE